MSFVLDLANYVDRWN